MRRCGSTSTMPSISWNGDSLGPRHEFALRTHRLEPFDRPLERRVTVAMPFELDQAGLDAEQPEQFAASPKTGRTSSTTGAPLGKSVFEWTVRRWRRASKTRGASRWVSVSPTRSSVWSGEMEWGCAWATTFSWCAFRGRSRRRSDRLRSAVMGMPSSTSCRRPPGVGTDATLIVSPQKGRGGKSHPFRNQVGARGFEPPTT